MSWHAKRTGPYTTNSTEFKENVLEIYNLLNNTTYLSGRYWNYEAIVGLLCNIVCESGMNPWRYNSIGAYGLVQFNPASYYIGGRGVGFTGYAPSTSTTATSDGADPSDGMAQCLVVDDPYQTKYLANSIKMNKARQLNWAILEWTSIDDYKLCDDIEQAIQAFLLFYEYPSNSITTLAQEYNNRNSYRQTIIDIIAGVDPPTPEPTPTPSPTPLPIAGSSKMIIYTNKRYRIKKRR